MPPSARKGKTFYSPWHIARCLEEPRDPTRDRGMSSVAPKGEGGNVRNLAYLALTENDQNSRRSRICRMRHVIVSRGVSSVRVSSRRLVVPLLEHGFCKARHSSFLRQECHRAMEWCGEGGEILRWIMRVCQ